MTSLLSRVVHYVPSQKTIKQQEDKGYIKVDRGISFAEGALLRSMEHNRSVTVMVRIHEANTRENRAALLLASTPQET